MSQQSFLLVDDDEIFCAILSRALNRRDMESTITHSPQQAIAALQSSPDDFSHAIVDLNMGQESGLNLIPELLKLDSELKIIVLTGYSSIATTVEAIKHGAINYLCKPASVDEIFTAFEDSENASNTAVDIKDKPLSIERLEWEYIQKTLAEHDGNISATARVLGMHRRTLQRKLQKKPVQH